MYKGVLVTKLNPNPPFDADLNESVHFDIIAISLKTLIFKNIAQQTEGGYPPSIKQRRVYPPSV
jgi:hypothetical protein